MTKYISLLKHMVLGLLAFSLMGCAWVGEWVGSGKNPPDEFVVVNKRPLTVPPDFQLRPPKPGVPSPQNIQPAEQVVNALFPGRTTVPATGSAGEIALLNKVGEPNRDVRSNAGDDTEVVDKGPMLSELLSTAPRQLASDGAQIERIRSETLR